MNIRNKRGFILAGKFYPTTGNGHEYLAMEIIRMNGWDKEWNSGSAQDFIVCVKRAIQLGSAGHHNRIVASRNFYNDSTIMKIAKKYKVDDYHIDLII